MTHIAHVGRSACATPHDEEAFNFVREMLAQANVLCSHPILNDFISLPTRDFLKETHRYQGAILYSIFDGDPGAMARPGIPVNRVWPAVEVSALHSHGAWRERLAGCGARWIVCVHLLPYSLFFADLPGYKSMHGRKASLHVRG